MPKIGDIILTRNCEYFGSGLQALVQAIQDVYLTVEIIDFRHCSKERKTYVLHKSYFDVK
jgi:hypothetical protein